MTFSFGKYRGHDIEEVRFRDPSYVKWAIETVDGFRRTAEKSALAFAWKSKGTKEHVRPDFDAVGDDEGDEKPPWADSVSTDVPPPLPPLLPAVADEVL
jgi:hypothetical protein